MSKPKPSWALAGTVEDGCRHGKLNNTVDIGPKQRGPQNDPIGNMFANMAQSSDSNESEEDSLMPETHQKLAKEIRKMSVGRGLEVCNMLEKTFEKARGNDGGSEESNALEKTIEKS